MDKSKSPREYIKSIKLKHPFESVSTYTSQRAKLLLLNENFQNTVSQLRKEFDIPVDGLFLSKHEEETGPWMSEEHLPIDASFSDWHDAISDILIKCQMLAGWRDAIQIYILHNIFIVPPSLSVENKLDENGSFDIRIQVNDYSSMDDIKFIHNYLRAKRTFAGYQRLRQIDKSIGSFDDYLHMLHYAMEGYKDIEISEKTKTNNEFAQAYTTKEVHDKLTFIRERVETQMS